MKNKPARKTAIVAGRGNKVSGRRQTKPSPEAVEEANPVKTGKPLTNAEKGRLQQCENTIGSGLASFVGVGKALSQINAQRLYREKSDTFENYCKRFWDMGAAYAYRLEKAAVCFDMLRAGLPQGALLPRNESQVRPLVDGLKPGKWVKAWKAVFADTDGVNLTAEAVEKVVRRLGGLSNHSKSKVRKKARQVMPRKAMAKIVKLVNAALRKETATLVELRKVLKQIQDRLEQLSQGPDS